MKTYKHRFWLCLAPLVAGVTDYVLTLLGQSAKYWGGNYHATRESAPHARWLLQLHPAWFLVAAALYIMAYCAAIVVLPARLSKTLAIGLVIGHCWGVASWLQYRYGSYWACILYFIICAALAAFSFELADKTPTIKK
ncbi:MAG: hypothetical protein NTX50_10380 [Candidatus Sumerlaeota bacterium]|nr:hypothetical protein [Candidatus Sumerlaeota bacterium]